MKKLRVGIIYGGRSGEHEVSLASAAAVFQNLDPARYEAVAIRIEKDGRWALPGRPPTLVSAADVIDAAKSNERHPAGLPPDETREAHLVAHPGTDTLLTIERHAANPVVSGYAGYAFADQADVLAERPCQPVECEVDRPELEHERAQLLERVLRERLQPLDLVACRSRIAVEQRPGSLRAEDKAEELLAHGVMELEREAVPLGDD